MKKKEIIKEKGKDGETIYKLDGKKINVSSECLCEIAECALERLQTLFNLIEDMDCYEDKDNINMSDICFLGEALIRDAVTLLNEHNDYILNNFGSVGVDKTTRINGIGILPDTIVGINFIPAEKTPGDSGESQPGA